MARQLDALPHKSSTLGIKNLAQKELFDFVKELHSGSEKEF